MKVTLTSLDSKGLYVMGIGDLFKNVFSDPLRDAVNDLRTNDAAADDGSGTTDDKSS